MQSLQADPREISDLSDRMIAIIVDAIATSLAGKELRSTVSVIPSVWL